MAEIIKVSEATNLAIHAMAYVAAVQTRSVSVVEIAERLQVSRDHLSKVLQRLARGGLLRSRRGPRGGFSLSRPSSEITLLQIVEATEGPVQPAGCLFGQKLCQSSCLLGTLTESLHLQVSQILAGTRLSALVASAPSSVLPTKPD